MDFKTRRIRNHVRETRPAKKPPANSESSESSRRGVSSKIKIQLLTIGGGLLVLFLMVFGIIQVMKSLDFSSIVFSFGKNLLADESGKTNILLIGVGGEGHDGSDLTDTIMVAGIDYKNKIVPMFSIPRDLYVDTEQTGRSRINYVYYAALKKFGVKEALYILKDTVTSITGVPIQYYIKVDFKGFVKIVDALGGVDVNVEEDIYDTKYPKGETIYYETFALKAGPQHLTGETALKYARSRHGSGRGDFDRAKRQQQLLFAIKEKALSLNVLTDPGKIQSLYNTVSESIQTNLSLGEIIELARVAKDLGKESVIPMVMNDDPTDCGGLVYTPAREYFDNASVLLPVGNGYDYTHLFINTTFKNANLLNKNEEIQVLNGTKVPGLALEGLNLLNRFCLNAVYYGNAENRELEISTIYYKPGPEGEKPVTLDMVTTLMPNIKVQEGIPEAYLQDEKRQNTVMVVELGKDYLEKRIKDPYYTLKYLTPPKAKAQQSQENSGQASAAAPASPTTSAEKTT